MLHLSGAMALLAVGVWVRWADWRDIFNIFLRDEEASHVILAPIVVAALVFVRRERLRHIELKTSWLGPVLVALGSVTCYYGEGNGYQAFRHLGAVLVAVGCLLSFLGREVLVNFAPAFGALLFLIPMPPTFRQRISLPMMPMTAAVTQEIMSVFGMDVTRGGNQLYIKGQPVLIAEACNGMRMFFTIVMVSYLVAFFIPLRGYVRALVILASPISALVCNVLRLIPTVWVFGNLSEETGHAFHDVTGYVMLPISFALPFLAVLALRWAMVPVSPFTLARD
jgi:exosortase